MPSLQTAVAPLGGFWVVAILFVAVFEVAVFAATGLFAVVVERFAGLLAAVFDAVFDTELEVDVELEIDIEFEFEFDVVFDRFAAELFALVAAPPHANVNAINENRETESISLFFINY